MKQLNNKANLVGAIAGIFGLGLLVGIKATPFVILLYGLALAGYGLCLAFKQYAKDSHRKKQQSMVKTKCHVAEYREKMNLTREQLAHYVGVSAQTIESIEKNKYTPSVNLASSISLVLNASLDDLFTPAVENEWKAAWKHV